MINYPDPKIERMLDRLNAFEAANLEDLGIDVSDVSEVGPDAARAIARTALIQSLDGYSDRATYLASPNLDRAFGLDGGEVICMDSTGMWRQADTAITFPGVQQERL